MHELDFLHKKDVMSGYLQCGHRVIQYLDKFIAFAPADHRLISSLDKLSVMSKAKLINTSTE